MFKGKPNERAKPAAAQATEGSGTSKAEDGSGAV